MKSPLESPPKQDPAKHQSILDVCLKLFAEKGFRNTDVDAVAELAGVGKGTVYRYFGSKEELFRATADSGMKQLETHIRATIAPLEEPVEVVRAAGLAYAGFFQEHPGLVEILIQERAEFRDSIPPTHLVYRARNRGILEDLLAKGIATGTFRNVDVHEATNALANMLYGTVVCGCLGGSSNRLTQMAEQAIDMFLNGVVTRNESESR